MGDLTGGLFKALAHFHLEAHFLDQIGGQMKGLWLAVEHHREEELAMKLFAIGAAAVGLAAPTAAFDKRTGQHLPQRAQTTNQPAAEVEFRVNWHLPLIIVSEYKEVKPLRKFAKMTGRVSGPLILPVQCIGPTMEIALRKRCEENPARWVTTGRGRVAIPLLPLRQSWLLWL